MKLSEELAQTFLFEHLSEEQVTELVAAGETVWFEPNEILIGEGMPAESLWVLLEGEIELSRYVGGQKVTLVTTSRAGIYAGGFRAYGKGAGAAYRATIRAVQRSRMFRLPAEDLARLLTAWFPMGKHLLDGLLQTVEWIDSIVRQRESLAVLGNMAAAMAHELNNPAAAAARTGEQLRSTLAALQEAQRDLVGSGLAPDSILSVFDLRTNILQETRPSPILGPLETADREDEISDWLSGEGVSGAWKWAPVLVASGLDLPRLQRAFGDVDARALGPAVRLLGASLTTSSLLDGLADATTRISELVAAVKDYTHMDRALVQEIDVRQGLESTLVMLGHKLPTGVVVERMYDRATPRVEGYGSELNQVWLNLLDNAIDAVGDVGRIWIRTGQEADGGALIEIGNTGPGVPAELQARVFEPYFTTKEKGKGTGLGLDIVRRIVIERHGGTVSIESVPGDTRFSVRLPPRVPAVAVPPTR
jgi:signal transduction histidine kinase